MEEFEYDDRLIQLFERLNEHNMTLNVAKCKFCTAEVNFMGHVLSTKGIETNPARIELIKQMKAPTSASKIRFFRLNRLLFTVHRQLCRENGTIASIDP